jgi:hypothetical protein
LPGREPFEGRQLRAPPPETRRNDLRPERPADLSGAEAPREDNVPVLGEHAILDSDDVSDAPSSSAEIPNIVHGG